MWLNNCGNVSDFFHKNSINSENILKWEIIFNEWFKTWKYYWEYYIDEDWKKFEHWIWILTLSDEENERIYDWRFEDWYFSQWTLKRFNNDKLVSLQRWKFIKWRFVEWYAEEGHLSWEWKFENWHLMDWYFLNSRTWRKIEVANWEKVKKSNNSFDIIDGEVNKKMSDTFLWLWRVGKDVFERLLNFFYSSSEWKSTERTRAISYWLELIWKIKKSFLSIEELKNKPSELLGLSINIKNDLEELNDIFYKYWFAEYNNIFNNFISISLDLLATIVKNATNFEQKNI